MKKIIFLAAIAALMMTSCSNDEVVEQYKGEEIGFNALMNNATRATPITSAPASKQSVKFQVWAFNGTEAYMGTDGVTVGWNGTKWDYSPKAYWPGTTALDFYGVSPETGTTPNMSSTAQTVEYTVPTDNANQKDLMYSVVKQHSRTNGTTVNMLFKHALSQIVFKGKIVNTNLSVDIQNVTICNVKDHIKVTLPNATTSTSTTSASATVDGTAQKYSIGMASASVTIPSDGTVKDLTKADDGALLLAPQTLTKWTTYSQTPVASAVPLPADGGNAYLKIECKIKQGSAYLLGSDTAWGNTYVPFEAAWEAGKKYIYTLKFGGGYDDQGEPILTPIEFSIDVEDWGDGGTTEINL